jgi:hypothetical protein
MNQSAPRHLIYFLIISVKKTFYQVDRVNSFVITKEKKAADLKKTKF